MSEHPKDEHAAAESAVQSEYAEHGANEPAADATPQADYDAFMRLVKENEELKDAKLRLAAEMENLRRRTARDVQDARAYSTANFARDMLSVADNLRRALDAIPEDARKTADTGLAALAEGVEMTERAMLAALERHGVKKIEPQGERFDPHFHQAMFEVPNPDVPANTVVQVVQTGFVIGDRVLRPAMVGVSKGGPKAAEAEPAAPDAQAEKDA